MERRQTDISFSVGSGEVNKRFKEEKKHHLGINMI